MRDLCVDPLTDPITTEILLSLQLRAGNEPFLPRLKRFECEEPTEAFAPFIPLFLSPRTIEIRIMFGVDSSTIVNASIISRLPMLCPELQRVTLGHLGRDPITTDAVSEMLLACNPDSLQQFHVDAPLTEEAREVLYQLPKLSELWVVFQGHTRLPSVALPNLTSIDIEFDDSLDWLQGFHGVALEKLDSIYLRSHSEKIGDLLGEFEKALLTTSAQNTLTAFAFYTSCRWNPRYFCLLSFKQLQDLEIEFSCEDRCSSRVDDDIIATLAQAMPKLEVLKLGDAPCHETTGATVKGLIDLTFLCPHLSKLRIHFQADTLFDAAMNAVSTPLPEEEPDSQREDCALTDLEVGDTPIPPQSGMKIALLLLQIFPRIRTVRYTNREWRAVAKTVKNFKQIGTYVRRIGTIHRHVRLTFKHSDALSGASS